MSSYKYQTPTPRTFSVLPAGDYTAVITEAEEPYEKNGKQIMKTQLAIQPNGQLVFYYPWAGQTKDGEYRDSIGELLLAANREPKAGEEPQWSKLAGAKIKVKLKVEQDQSGVDRNAVHYVIAPKKADAGRPAATQQSVSTSDFMKARAKQVTASGGEKEPEPDELPY
jgi:hypothetical protein